MNYTYHILDIYIQWLNWAGALRGSAPAHKPARLQSVAYRKLCHIKFDESDAFENIFLIINERF